jgi:uncharacterized repeat protein (TIGR02543 family)/uncharacterized delta-60 repeat protein
MKKFIFFSMTFIILNSFINLKAQWIKTFGGSFEDSIYAPVQQTSDEGYILAGCTYSFGSGASDLWIVKLNSNGEIDWQKAYGGTSYESAYSIRQTSDGGYIVAGETSSFGAGNYDIWILKLSPTGDIEWQKTYGGGQEDYAMSIEQTSDGGYIAAGVTSSFGAGSRDAWVLKLHSDGSVDWQKAYGGSSNDYAWAIQQTSDGGYIMAGETYSFGDASDNGWILKLSPEGNIEWQRIYGGSDKDWFSAIQQTSDGSYVACGNSYSFGAGYSDGWIIKLTSNGNIEWQRAYGGANYDYVFFTQQTDEGGYIVAGYTYSFGAGDDDVWILKLTSTGDIEWQRTYGGSSSDAVRSINKTSDGGYVIGALTSSFGAGDLDYFILKLYSDGGINSSCEVIGTASASSSSISGSPGSCNAAVAVTNSVGSDTTLTGGQDTDATVMTICETGKYSLTIFSSGGGTTDPSPGNYTYDPGSEVTITATADSGYEFNGWSGDASGTTNPITITMDSSKSVTANFKIPNAKLCFIATAAYGSPLHSSVKILRNFRESYLIRSKPGRKFLNLYYKYSPSIAAFVTKHRALRFVIRMSLLPLVAFSYSMLRLGPILTTIIFVFILAIPISLISFYRSKKRRKKIKKS